MKKRVISMMIALCMVTTLFAGCSSKSSGTDSGKEAAGNGTVTPAGTEAEATKNNFSDKDFTTLKITMFGETTTQEAEAVSEALSKITKEKLNCNVDITFIGSGSYLTQLNLLLSSGEQFDLFNTFVLDTATLANLGQILPIDDMLKNYGQNTLKAISTDDWRCTQVGGQTYGVPGNKDKAYDLGFCMRKDILEEVGGSIDTIKDFSGLHDLLAKVKKAHPEMYPVVSGFGQIFGYLAVDNLGDSNGVLMDPYTSDSLKVENLIASDYYKNLCEQMYNWAEEGLIMPDASTNTESGTSLVKSGKAFGFFSHEKPGFDSENSATIGKEMVSWIYKEPITITANASSFLWAIPSTSVDPERAMALLDLMYNDPEVANLCINGVEGTHYKVIDKEKGIIGYPDGKDSLNVGYSRFAWAWPNEQISYIWNGDSETVWKDMDTFNKSAKVSPAKGFSFDNSKVINEITACKNINDKYNKALMGGQLDPKDAIPKYLKELKDNGIDTIIAEKQKQLDEWVAANKK